MTDVIITAIIGATTTVISSVITFLTTKRKYYSEVDSQLITNMKESLEFYKTLSDDNKARLLEQIDRNDKLELQLIDMQKELNSIKNQMMNMMGQICLTFSCQDRVLAKKK